MVPSNNSHFQKRDNKELRSAFQRIEKLNAVLASIRNVNQLITREKNPEKLIKRSCKLLTEQQGCHTAWIAHLDSEEKLLSVAQSGLGAKFTPLKKRIQRGEMPHCWHIVRKKKDAAIFKNPSKVCGDCPLPEKQENYCALSVGMYCKDRNFGILSVFIEPEYMDDKEFRDLFVEVAGDIALGLYNIEIEVSLKQSEARLLRAQRIGKLGNWEWDIEKNELHWCDEIYRIWDWQPDEPLTYEGIIQRIHPDNREFNEGYLREFLEDRDEGSFEFRISLPDGEVKYISQTIEVERGSDGKAIRMFGIMQDITARKSSEEALKESEERLRQAQTVAHIGNWKYNVETDELYWSDELYRIYGLDPADKAAPEHGTGFIHPEDKQFAETAFKKTVDEGKSFEIEYRIIRPDGDIRFIRSIGHAGRDEQGKILSVYGTGQDTTEIKKVEVASRRSEATLQGILRAAPVGIGLLYNRSFDWINEGFAEITGYTAEELKGKNARILYNNDAEYERVGALKYGQIAEKGTGALETQFVRKDGSLVDVFISTAALDPDDPSAGYVSTAFDITERKRARERIDYQAKLLENISEAVISTDLDFRVKSWNKAAETIYGWREDEVLGKGIKGLLSTGFTGTTSEEAVEVLKKDSIWRGEVIQECKDGRMLNISASVVLTKDSQGNPSGIVAVNHDITELKAVERQLRESEHKYRQLYERSLDGIVSTDLKGNFAGCNESYEKMLGYTLEELKHLTYHELTPEKWHVMEEKIVRENIFKKGYSGLYEKEYIRKDGVIIQVELSSYLIKDENTEPIGMWGIARDITAKKRAEQALLAEKERLNVTLRSIGDAVITTDMKGNVILINSIAEKLTGWSENEAKGQHITSIFAIVNEHTRETAENPVEKVLKWGITVGLANHTVLISRDGQDRFIDDSGAPIRNEDGEIVGVVLVFRDVTDQRRMQEYLSRAQRLETAGQIAGQIAHDFNNLLGPLIAYPDFIRMQIPNGHEVLNFVNDMEKAAEQIAEINQQLLTLSRRGYYKQEALDLNEIVSDAINQTKPHADTLLINLEPEEELYRVKGGRSQIYRVIVNLLNNAREAMTDIGTLTVRTENFYVDEIFGKFGRVPKGEYVKLSIIDTGHGISNDLLSKIFDPFFTTKEADKRRGSGLGLSVVHAVVQDHKAFIDLETTIGKGTAFYIYFPLTREEAGRSEPESIIRGNNESVLVVDDDVIQREVSLRLLSELGYRAEAAKSGEEAIELLKEGPRDLLLLDMVMPPGMDGTETYQKAVQINPEQKAIIISGFAESERVRKLQELGAGEYIRKPLNMKVLSAAVRRELERTGEPENKLRD